MIIDFDIFTKNCILSDRDKLMRINAYTLIKENTFINNDITTVDVHR